MAGKKIKNSKIKMCVLKQIFCFKTEFITFVSNSLLNATQFKKR